MTVLIGVTLILLGALQLALGVLAYRRLVSLLGPPDTVPEAPPIPLPRPDVLRELRETERVLARRAGKRGPR